jgi:hypothetical protein
LPGDLTIPEQIARNKKPYYAALEAADRELKRGHIDLSALEELLNAHLANQLYDFYQKASGDHRQLGELPSEELDRILEEARHEGAQDREAVYAHPASQRGVFRWIEQHPAVAGIFGALLAAVLTWVLTKFT